MKSPRRTFLRLAAGIGAILSEAIDKWATVIRFAGIKAEEVHTRHVVHAKGDPPCRRKRLTACAAIS